MSAPLRIAFLGCGFITRVHSRHLRRLGAHFVRSYASRDRLKAEDYCKRYGGAAAYTDYVAAIDDPHVDAVEPRFAAVGSDQAAKNVDRRGLAGAVRPEQAIDLARSHMEADAAQRVHSTEALSEIDDFNETG